MVVDVDYEATNGRVCRASRPLSNVTIDGPNVTWSVSDVAVQSVGDWKYKLAGGLFSDKGTYDFSMNGISFQFAANIEKMAGGGEEFVVFCCHMS